MTREKLLELLEKYNAGQCTGQELAELNAWYASLDKPVGDLFATGSPEAKAITQLKLAELKTALNIQNEQAPVVQLYNRPRWRKWAIAASVIIILGAGSYFITLSLTKSDKQSVAANQQHLGADVLPGFDGAILTTSSGEKIILDNAQNGVVATENNTEVVKQDNQLVYGSRLTSHDSPLTFNTLTTPNGRKFELVLADGTKVYLDASSSITYPTAFTANERKVTITGQAYFEVAKDAAKPFKVNANNKGEVTVLGTHFNVNAYEDEDGLKVTLLEGSVKVKSEAGSQQPEVVIRPGEQAVASSHSPLIIHHSPDLELVMAWKNGFTSFRSADIKTIMRQVSRWYDVDVEYEGNTPSRTFTADVSRNVNLSRLLKIFEASNIRFRIEGRRLIVLP